MNSNGIRSWVSNDLGEVSLCECGGLNLTIGAVTIHLAADEVEPFTALVQAAANLSQPASIQVKPIRMLQGQSQ